MISVVVADDQALVRTGLRTILENAGGFDILGKVSSKPSDPEISTRWVATPRVTDAVVVVTAGAVPPSALGRSASRNQVAATAITVVAATMPATGIGLVMRPSAAIPAGTSGMRSAPQAGQGQRSCC